jgi:hypothetical protein
MADAKGSFITYSTIEWLPPVLFLHLVLLPLNEIVRATQAVGDLIQADGVVGVTLRPDMTSRGTIASGALPIFLGMPKATRPA